MSLTKEFMLIFVFLGSFTPFCCGAPTAVRGEILHFIGDPDKRAENYQYWNDGLLVVDKGKILDLGDAENLLNKYPNIHITQYPDSLIMPGFIDTHVHYPQVEMIAAFGEQLLEWLNRYTFPTESKYSDMEYARCGARFFLSELLRNGTTTALVFGTVHKTSVDAFFEQAEALNMRMIAGKVLMDRNARKDLLDTPKSAYADSKELIMRWHKKGRLLYAITPRFAFTSSAEQLAMAGKLAQEYNDVFIHTHLSENIDEVALVKSLFPARKGYLDVYHHAGLVRERSVFAHGVQLTDKEFKTLAEADAAISFCPTSNLFLGSGLFNLPKAEQYGVHVGIGSDVGAGTSLSTFRSLNEAYKIMQLQKKKLSPFKAFYLATLGGARSLHLDNFIGNFEKDKEADFIVIDLKATPLIDYRLRNSSTLFDRLFALMMLADDRAIKATYIAGKLTRPFEGPDGLIYTNQCHQNNLEQTTSVGIKLNNNN